ncbi:hypothetical protein [Nocardia sp. IFM 10818]
MPDTIGEPDHDEHAAARTTSESHHELTIATTERDVYDAIADHLEAQTAAVFDPENNLVADLLTLDANHAAAVLDHVHDDDLQAHMPRVIITLIRQLCTAGTDPTPQAVAARARGPIAATPRPSHQAIVMYLTTVYTSRLPLTAWADAAQVVEDSYRRSFAEYGARMEQMADAYAPIEDLEHVTGDAVSLWRQMRERLARLRAYSTT